MEVSNGTENMTTSSQVLNRLVEKGIGKQWQFNGAGLCIDDGRPYQADDLEIIKTFRFEGSSDPSDMEVIYVIRANDGVTGYFQDAYGTYAGQEGEERRDNFIRQIEVAGHDEQLSFEL